VRVIVIRNHGGLWQGPKPLKDHDVLAYTRDITKWNPTAKLDLVPNARLAAGPFAGAKYLSWAENLTLLERAHQKGLDDALLLNERGEVAECTSANIFAVHGHRVSTPPLSSGCLPGITRAILLEEIRVEGISIGERRLLPADLESADEVFMTSSTRELITVDTVEGLHIRNAATVRDRLQSAFSGYVAGQRHAAEAVL
jgi:branched-chain amino acid aminotransferase